MQFVAEHQFLVDIQDILPTGQIDGPLRLMHRFVVLHVTHLMTHPCLSRLTVHPLGNVEQYMTTRATHRTVHHIDAQFTLTSHQRLGIQLREVLAAVQVYDALARIHRLALVALISLVEVRMRRVESGSQLYFGLLRLIVLLAHVTTPLGFQDVSQLGTDTTSLL